MFPPIQAGKYKNAPPVLIVAKDDGSGGAVSTVRNEPFRAHTSHSIRQNVDPQPQTWYNLEPMFGFDRVHTILYHYLAA